MTQDKHKNLLSLEERKALKNNGMIQLTRWSRVDDVINTIEGNITIHQWHLNEKDRICKDEDREAEIIEKDGYESLWVDDISERKY